MSKIEWTDKTWNPVTGCTKVSQGCKNCYAETFNNRFGKGRAFSDIQLHQDRLTDPLKWKQPKRVFVNSMSDLFHENIPFEFINAVFSVMSDISQHTYQVLTKRPDNALKFIDWKSDQHHNCWLPPDNVYIGVSVEDQTNADQRVPKLLEIPSAKRFLSMEPLLDRVNIDQWIENIDWVIVGGESGAKARPLHPNWVRVVRDLCLEYKTPFFFKQWGEYLPFEEDAQPPFYNDMLGNLHDAHNLQFTDPPTGEPSKAWYHDEYYGIEEGMNHNARHCKFKRTGKKVSLNYLDGKQHLEIPENHLKA